MSRYSLELLGLGVVSDEGEEGESKVALRSDECDVELAEGVHSCMIAEAETICNLVTLNNAWVIYHTPTRLSRH